MVRASSRLGKSGAPAAGVVCAMPAPDFPVRPQSGGQRGEGGVRPAVRLQAGEKLRGAARRSNGDMHQPGHKQTPIRLGQQPPHGGPSIEPLGGRGGSLWTEKSARNAAAKSSRRSSGSNAPPGGTYRARVCRHTEAGCEASPRRSTRPAKAPSAPGTCWALSTRPTIRPDRHRAHRVIRSRAGGESGVQEQGLCDSQLTGTDPGEDQAFHGRVLNWTGAWPVLHSGGGKGQLGR